DDLLRGPGGVAEHDHPDLGEERQDGDHPLELETRRLDLGGQRAAGEPRAALRRTAEQAPARPAEALQGVGMADGGDQRPAREPGERAEHAWPALGRDVHQEARAHHLEEAPRPPRRRFQVGAQEPEGMVARARHLEHGGGDVGADDAEAARRQVAADEAGAARHVEHEPAAVDARERAREHAHEKAQVQPADEAAVAAPLVAARVEVAIAPARVVVRRHGRRHWRTVTARRAGCNCARPLAACGRPELALRLPSAVLGTGAVLGTWATARAVWGAAAGLPAALVLATTFEWTRAAMSARVDMALAAALTAALAGWTLALARGTRGATVLAALGVALGALAKGPVALVLPALAAAGLRIARREVRPLRVATVLGGAAVLAGLWYAAAFAREGSAFLDVVAREN